MNILVWLKVERKRKEKIILGVDSRRGCALKERDFNICRRFKVLQQ